MKKNRVFWKDFWNFKIKRTNRFDKVTFAIILIASLILPMIFVESTMRFNFGQNDYTKLIIFVVLMFSSITLSSVILTYLTADLFDHNIERKSRLRKLAMAFSITLLTFTNLYYMSSAINDYNDSISKYLTYKTMYNYYKDEVKYIVESNNLIKDNRTFNGVSERLFSGVDYYGMDDFEKYPPFKIFENTIMNEENDIIRPLNKNRISVYITCLLYSSGMLTNTGDSGITPNTWDARLLTLIEKLFSFVYLVVILGMLLSGWWDVIKTK